MNLKQNPRASPHCEVSKEKNLIQVELKFLINETM